MSSIRPATVLSLADLVMPASPLKVIRPKDERNLGLLNFLDVKRKAFSKNIKITWPVNFGSTVKAGVTDGASAITSGEFVNQTSDTAVLDTGLYRSGFKFNDIEIADAVRNGGLALKHMHTVLHKRREAEVQLLLLLAKEIWLGDGSANRILGIDGIIDSVSYGGLTHAEWVAYAPLVTTTTISRSAFDLAALDKHIEAFRREAGSIELIAMGSAAFKAFREKVSADVRANTRYENGETVVSVGVNQILYAGSVKVIEDDNAPANNIYLFADLSQVRVYLQEVSAPDQDIIYNELAMDALSKGFAEQLVKSNGIIQGGEVLAHTLGNSKRARAMAMQRASRAPLTHTRVESDTSLEVVAAVYMRPAFVCATPKVLGRIITEA